MNINTQYNLTNHLCSKSLIAFGNKAKSPERLACDAYLKGLPAGSTLPKRKELARLARAANPNAVFDRTKLHNAALAALHRFRHPSNKATKKLGRSRKARKYLDEQLKAIQANPSTWVNPITQKPLSPGEKFELTTLELCQLALGPKNIKKQDRSACSAVLGFFDATPNSPIVKITPLTRMIRNCSAQLHSLANQSQAKQPINATLLAEQLTTERPPKAKLIRAAQQALRQFKPLAQHFVLIPEASAEPEATVQAKSKQQDFKQRCQAHVDALIEQMTKDRAGQQPPFARIWIKAKELAQVVSGKTPTDEETRIATKITGVLPEAFFDLRRRPYTPRTTLA